MFSFLKVKVKKIPINLIKIVVNGKRVSKEIPFFIFFVITLSITNQKT